MSDQKYCPRCFKPMTQGKKDPYIYYCLGPHIDGKGAWIDTDPMRPYKHKKDVIRVLPEDLRDLEDYDQQ